MTIDMLTFDVAGLTLLRENDAERVWRSPLGVVTGAYLFQSPPEWTFDLTDSTACAAFIAQGVDGVVLSTAVTTVGGYEALQAVYRFRLSMEEGRMRESLLWYFHAVVFLPFADAFFRINIMAKESGMTGVRESTVAVIGRQNAMLPQAWDDEFYDGTFPSHSLSLVRTRLREVRDTLALTPGDAAPMPFRYTPPQAS